MKLTYRIDKDLTLRFLEPRHAEALFVVIDANRRAILPGMRWVQEVTDAEVLRGMIGDWIKQTAETGCMSLGIELDDELVGAVFHVRPDTANNQVEVGYWLAESARGKGVATRAVRAFIDVTIRDLGFHRVNIRIAPQNTSSLALAERLGLKPEGISRQAWKVGNEFWDATEFGVLADEWDVKSPPFALTHWVDKELALRLVERRHADELYGVIDANREHIKKWMSWLTDTYASVDTDTFIRLDLTRQAECKGMNLAMVFKGKLVGGIGNGPADLINRSADIGYWLAEHAQGKGIVTRAAHEMINYSVRDLGLNRVTIHAAAGNAKSQAVPERLGFDRVGIFRKAVPVHGVFVDWVQYAMLAEDWKGRVK